MSLTLFINESNMTFNTPEPNLPPEIPHEPDEPPISPGRPAPEYLRRPTNL